ncbi:MAG: OmpA family protein [Parvibaculales bacterium]
MRNMMSRYKTRILSLFAFVILLAGCSADYNNVQRFMDEPIAPSSLNACLAEGYRVFAKEEVKKDGSWGGAVFLAKKGIAAKRNKQVSPYNIQDFATTNANIEEIDFARQRLIQALQGANSFSQQCACGNAQAAYDRWVEQATDNLYGDSGSFYRRAGGPASKEDVAIARENFENAMAKGCEKGRPVRVKRAAQSQMLVMVTFKHDSQELTPKTVNILYRLRNQLKDQTILLVGHTDSVGPDNYNYHLGLRRAKSVAKKIEEFNIKKVQVRSRGEKQLLIPTRDGVSNEQNRRVEIFLIR